ncbi:MAG: hypothetical protein H6945_06250 [Zoogloeaceae bacterium]|nr:hypothetical protein [Rhodocyclaceae bacterium]MCP5235324.1 hypothetical protein [Zoogloeaceae bacterium]
MPAERRCAGLLLLIGCLLPLRATPGDAPPSPELLEWLAELDVDDDPMTVLDILAADGVALPAVETTDED